MKFVGLDGLDWNEAISEAKNSLRQPQPLSKIRLLSRLTSESLKRSKEGSRQYHCNITQKQTEENKKKAEAKLNMVHSVTLLLIQWKMVSHNLRIRYGYNSIYFLLHSGWIKSPPNPILFLYNVRAVYQCWSRSSYSCAYITITLKCLK